MAAKEIIAAKRIRAMKRIDAAVRAFAEKHGRDYPPLPMQGRDKAMLHANQLEVLAAILEDALTVTPVGKEGE
jgi:hypothetical protein